MNTQTTIAGVTFKNPVMTASGTFGSGMEYEEFVDLNRLGAVVTKGVANVPWPGNPTPRVAEVYGGMLNAIGLQNPGIDVFMERDIPFLKKYDTKIIVNVCGKSVEDYVDVVERLGDEPAVSMLEINVSCPNVKEGAIAFGQKADALYNITSELKKHAKQPIIMKLSPNVTDITEMAKAAEAAGADALSLISSMTTSPFSRFRVLISGLSSGRFRSSSMVNCMTVDRFTRSICIFLLISSTITDLHIYRYVYIYEGLCCFIPYSVLCPLIPPHR